MHCSHVDIPSCLGYLAQLGPHMEHTEYLWNIKSDKIGRNWIQFNATVAETEQLFNTVYHYYEHDLSGGYRIACDEYHLPQNVREHVDFAVSSLLLPN